MKQKPNWQRILLRSLSYILVAALASTLTLILCLGTNTKLLELENIIDQRFIGEADLEDARDAAAQAMVKALGDRWSYYIPAEDYAAYRENKDNAFVGIGITIVVREDGMGFDILSVEPGGSAQESGILPGDILVEAAGQSVLELDAEGVKTLIRGKAGTEVTVAVLREEEKLSFSLERREIRVEVASGQMLSDQIGLIKIANFNSNCAAETIAAVETLVEQGAKGLIFDVRNNPGGYVDEMIKVLDYLLPEGVLFRDLNYKGITSERHSDESCLELPIAVLMNGNSYSAAEFFPAVLREYEWATLVGENTTGKGHYQITYRLSDGSAVNLSTGKYFTPNGVNLTEAGGLVPDVTVEVDEDMAAMIYAQVLDPLKDPQIQAALALLNEDRG